ncbi:hypothetical protein BJX70DRAFT_110017 [Aspergillus crustosus]
MIWTMAATVRTENGNCQSSTGWIRRLHGPRALVMHALAAPRLIHIQHSTMATIGSFVRSTCRCQKVGLQQLSLSAHEPGALCCVKHHIPSPPPNTCLPYLSRSIISAAEKSDEAANLSTHSSDNHVFRGVTDRLGPRGKTLLHTGTLNLSPGFKAL